MTKLLDKYIPFAINIEHTSNQDAESFYEFIQENSTRNYDDETIDLCDEYNYMGVRKDNVDDVWIYFLGRPEGFSRNINLSTTVFTENEFKEIMKGSTLTNVSQENSTMTNNTALEMLALVSNDSSVQTVYHFRNIGVDGKPTCKGGRTVVLAHMPDTNEVLMGVSACSEDDTFNRKEGILRAKLNMEPVGVFEKVPAKFEIREFIGRNGTDLHVRLMQHSRKMK